MIASDARVPVGEIPRSFLRKCQTYNAQIPNASLRWKDCPYNSGAEDEFGRAIALDSSYSTAHQ